MASVAAERQYLISSIPALKNVLGSWVFESKQKANLFGSAFASKYVLPVEQRNEYSDIAVSHYKAQGALAKLA